MELNKELIAAYLGGLSMRQCEDKFSMGHGTVLYRLKKSGITIRSKAENLALKYATAPWRDKELMLDLYEVQKLSTLQIAMRFQCDKSVVVDWLNTFGAAMRATSETQIGREPGNKGTGKRNSEETVLCACGCGTNTKRYGFNSNEATMAPGHRVKGAAHPLYKPHSENKKKRHEGTDYREWRKQVLEAGSYTCATCAKVGGQLQSHHVMPVSVHPEFIYEVWNGKALCKPCHIEAHSAAREIN